MAADPDDPNTPNGRISYKFLDDGLDAVAFNIGERVPLFVYLKQCFVRISVGVPKCIFTTDLNTDENAVYLTQSV
jgi:hypothetical protein